MPVKNHDEAIKLVFDSLLDAHKGALKSMDEIGGIGHRVVHGGEKFNESCLIDDDVIEAIKRFSKFAPLHNPHNLKGIEVCKKLLPDTPQVAVFDTSFHSHMPPEAFMYAIPYNEYIDNGIRRFGFHGTSHYYVSKKASEILDIPLDELKMITCHLGNGASMAAVQYGVSVDTTMGFTPLEGLIMGTRSGDIDPAIIMYIMDNENLSTKEVDNLLNKKSGLIGVSEISNDMREIEEKAKQGNKKASLALNMFTRRIKKYIGAYTALMGGLDVIVFTAGIGENSSVIRAKSLEGLEFLGVFIDKDKNASNETIISIGRVNVMVIPTNEELVIAVDTRNIIERQEKIKAQRTTL
jgi:acetate kinase